MSRLIALASLLIVVTAAVAEDGGPPAPPTAPVAPPGGAPGGTQGGFDPFILIMIVGMFLFMWLLVFRPQKKEEARRKELINSMKPGHRVITIGGIHGDVVSVGEKEVEVAVTKGDKPVIMTFNRGAISTNETLAEQAKPAK
jgi:preprotein translocase subunit YajC